MNLEPYFPTPRCPHGRVIDEVGCVDCESRSDNKMNTDSELTPQERCSNCSGLFLAASLSLKGECIECATLYRDQPTPQGKLEPGKYHFKEPIFITAAQHEPVKCSTCGKTENQFCSNSFHQPEPAKDEFKLMGVYQTKDKLLWQAIIETGIYPSDFISICRPSKQEAESIAKQIMEEHSGAKQKELYRQETHRWKDAHDKLRLELEQARTLYQDRCQAVATLRAKVGELGQFTRHKTNCACNEVKGLRCDCGLSVLLLEEKK